MSEEQMSLPLQPLPARSSKYKTSLGLVHWTKDFGAVLTAWPTIPGEWFVQSRDGAVSRRLRELKLKRVAYAIFGDHMTIWKVSGDATRVAHLIHSLTPILNGKSDRETTTRKSSVRRFDGSTKGRTAK